MTIPEMKTFSKLYPMFVQKYETFLPSDDNTIIAKINSIVDNLNKVGSLSNNVVDNWNQVMGWFLNNGLSDEVTAKIQNMVSNGDFDTIINQTLLGDINAHLTNVDTHLTSIDLSLADIATFLKPTGTSDDTNFVQTALNNNPIVVLDAGTYYINAITSLNVPSNTTLIFKKGAVLQVINNTNTINYCLYLNNVQNVTITNPTVIGDRLTSTGAKGASHGICITGTSSNIRIDNPNCSNCRGDGFVVYGGSNIYVENLVSNNNCRMGLTVTNGTNVTFINPICSNSNGTAPQAGIDLEPNYSTDELQNIFILNPITKNNSGSGITMHLGQLNGQTHDVSIEITGHKDYGSLNGLAILSMPTPNPAIRGSIKINGTELHENVNGSLLFQNYSSINTPAVQINDPKIFNCNTANVTATNGSAVILSRTDSSSYSMGNLHIRNLMIVDDRASILTPQAVLASDSQNNFSNIVIDGVHFSGIDSLAYDHGGLPNLAGIVCLDPWKNRVWYFNQTSGDYDCWLGYPTVIYNGSTAITQTATIRNVGAETWNETTFIHEGTGGGILKIVPTGCLILGLTTVAGNYIQSSVLGSSITLRKISSTQFMVVKQTGTWTSQG